MTDVGGFLGISESNVFQLEVLGIWEEVVMLESLFIFQDSLCDNMPKLQRFKKKISSSLG